MADSTPDRAMPAALAALHDIEFEDFECDTEFLDADETAVWFRAWTNNPEVTGEQFLVFGGDATGGNAAVWLAREGEPVSQQPIVYSGSEGFAGPLACNLGDFLWLLASGVEPTDLEYEDVDMDDDFGVEPKPEVAVLAAQLAPEPRTPQQVVEAAREAYGGFSEWIWSLVKPYEPPTKP